MSDQKFETEDFSDKEIRRKIWRHSITSVGLVTSAWEGQEDVMACEWAMQCSVTPLQYLIVIGKKKMTAELITKSKEFGLTFASDAQGSLSHLAGSFSGYNFDKIATKEFSLRKGVKIKAPIVTGGILMLECKVNQTISNGDRFIFIGDIVYAEYDDEKSPLLYHSGKYFKLGEQLPKT